MLTSGGPCHAVPCVPSWIAPSGLVLRRAAKAAVRAQAADV